MGTPRVSPVWCFQQGPAKAAIADHPTRIGGPAVGPLSFGVRDRESTVCPRNMPAPAPFRIFVQPDIFPGRPNCPAKVQESFFFAVAFGLKNVYNSRFWTGRETRTSPVPIPVRRPPMMAGQSKCPRPTAGPEPGKPAAFALVLYPFCLAARAGELNSSP